MRTLLRAISVTAGAVVAAGVFAVPSAHADTLTVQQALASLSTATEVRTGYSRSLFPLWVDADGDGCNTREEVLIAESTITPSIGSGCSVSGKWFSYYDGATWTAASDVDIDHLVPLAEAWDSGARTWTTSVRQAYANDLGDPRTLVAVTDNVNQSKGDADPAQWLPPLASVHCRYLNEWVAIKYRWRLSVDTTERNALNTLAGQCPNTTLTITRAR
ncbi:MAG TPA: HNH endonuclease family protein [Mycobacteriales bacterium]